MNFLARILQISPEGKALCYMRVFFNVWGDVRSCNRET